MIAAGVAALAAAAGWVEVAWTGRLAIGLAVDLATDLVTLCGIVVIAGALWRESAAETGTAMRRAMRWFAACNLAVVACLMLSFGAGLAWAVWRGAVQTLAHSSAVFVYEVLLVA